MYLSYLDTNNIPAEQYSEFQIFPNAIHFYGNVVYVLGTDRADSYSLLKFSLTLTDVATIYEIAYNKGEARMMIGYSANSFIVGGS